MNRRTIISASASLFLSPLAVTPMRGWTLPGAAAASAGGVVASYHDVEPVYQAATALLLAQGRAVAAQLIAGDGAVFDKFSPDLQAVYTKAVLASLIPTATTNRVYFEIAELSVNVGGHLAGKTIDGEFSGGLNCAFKLSTDGDVAQDAPFQGEWAGQIDFGTVQYDIAVSFVTKNGKTSGTIDVPAREIVSLALSNFTFTTIMPIGARTAERASVLSSSNRFYLARYAWSNAEIAVTTGIATDGQVTGLLLVPEWPLAVDPAAGYVSTVAYRLPFTGVWWAVWAGDTIMQNYHVEAPGQRHASDIVIWNDGGTHKGDGASNEDYWAFGQDIFAPAAGTVVAVVDGLPNNVPGTPTPDPDPAGNHVVIQTAPKEFVYLAHLKSGSIVVKEGQTLAAGAKVGLCGNSGNSSEPHLHIHVQNVAAFEDPKAMGLPLHFANYLADGEPIADGQPVQGQFIARQ